MQQSWGYCGPSKSTSAQNTITNIPIPCIFSCLSTRHYCLSGDLRAQLCQSNCSQNQKKHIRMIQRGRCDGKKISWFARLESAVCIMGCFLTDTSPNYAVFIIIHYDRFYTFYGMENTLTPNRHNLMLQKCVCIGYSLQPAAKPIPEFALST